MLIFFERMAAIRGGADPVRVAVRVRGSFPTPFAEVRLGVAEQGRTANRSDAGDHGGRQFRRPAERVLFTAPIAEAEKEWPHSSSVIALTLRVEAP